MSNSLVGWPSMVSSWSVPVTVDALRQVRDRVDGEAYEVVRGVYFVVDVADVTPVQIRPLPEGGPPLPAVLVGGTAIITGPVSGADVFRTAQDLTETFNMVEEDGTVMEIEDVWLPTRWLADAGGIARGDVFRVGERTFRTAYSNRVEGRPVGSLMEFPLQELDIVRSEVETAAFRDWSAMQIEEAAERYPKDEDLALRWT